MNSTLLDKLKTLKEEEKEILKGNNVINLNLYMSPSSSIVDSNKILGQNKLIYVQAHTVLYIFLNMAIIMLNLFICVRVIHFIL